MGVLVLFGVYVRVPDFWKLPNGKMLDIGVKSCSVVTCAVALRVS